MSQLSRDMQVLFRDFSNRVLIRKSQSPEKLRDLCIGLRDLSVEIQLNAENANLAEVRISRHARNRDTLQLFRYPLLLP